MILQIKICSDIFDKSKVLLKPYGFSVILFAGNCPKDNITMRSIISLRSNITRRKANKTAECPYEHSAYSSGFFYSFYLFFIHVKNDTPIIADCNYEKYPCPFPCAHKESEYEEKYKCKFKNRESEQKTFFCFCSCSYCEMIV